MFNKRLLETYGEKACNNAWDNACRIGLRQKIWRKMWKAIKEKDDSYLRTMSFIVLKDTEYANKGDIKKFVTPHYGYHHLGNDVYVSTDELEEKVGSGELFPEILLDNICNDARELFRLNKTEEIKWLITNK